MRQTVSAFLLAALATIVFACAAFGQDPVSSVLKMGFTDVAETKRQAEAGDRAAQLSLANTLVSNMRPADALPWYQKAAAQGSIEAVCKMGGLLIKGSPGVPGEKTLKADPATGIQLIFCAATNRYATAYYGMYVAYRDGLGVARDVLQAYAWLQLDVDSSPGGFLTASGHQSELNRLALDVDVATSQEGKRLAAIYKAGHWPTLTVVVPAPAPTPTPAPSSFSKQGPPRTVREAMQRQNSAMSLPQPDTDLKLTGIASGQTPLAIINGKGLAEGETATIVLRPQPVTIKCIKIETDSVLVSLDGEVTPRRLTRN